MTGIIYLNKPPGITSFVAVAKLRRILGAKKAGHTGTLDPMAVGVLPVLVGGATRFAEFMPPEKKGYKATMKLGITTDTLDITGKVLSTCDDFLVSFEDVKESALKFSGRIQQTPPMYSAISKDGVRLYKLARQGIEIKRDQREIEIYSININETNVKDEYEIEVFCSPGTYVRTLVDDIGRDLNCGAVMTKLVRTESNGVTLDECKTLEQIEKAEIKPLVPIDIALLNLKPIVVTAAQATRFSNGGNLSIDRIKNCKEDGLYRVYSNHNIFIGVGEICQVSKMLNVRKILSNT